MDPNKPQSGTCKSCVANEKIQKSLPTENHLNQSSSIEDVVTNDDE